MRNLIGARMEAQQMIVFLHIAYRADPVPFVELAKAADLQRGTISNNVMALGDGKPGAPGYGLVIATEDPMERRRKMAKLTRKGREVATSVLSAIQGRESSL